MADLKITQLIADTTPQGADLLTSVKSPFGAGSNRKVTVTDFMQNQTIDWQTTGGFAFGADATLGTVGGIYKIWNIADTVTDFSATDQYPFYATIEFAPTGDLTNATIAGYEFVTTVAASNTHDIAAYNFSALEGFWNNDGSGNVNVGFGIFGAAYNNGSGDITSELVGGYFFSANYSSGNISGTAQKDGNFACAVGTGNYGTGIVQRNFHFYAETPYGTGEIKNNWGLYLEPQDVGTTDSWAIQTTGGKVEFGCAAGKSQLFYLSDGDVAHGMTGIAPTNVFARFAPVITTSGGLSIIGLSDDTETPLFLGGYIGTNAALNPCIRLSARKANGTITQAIGANEKAFAVDNFSTDIFIMYGSGNAAFTGTISSPGAGSNSERFGLTSTAAGTSSLALGNSASSGDTNSIAIGKSAIISSGGSNTIVIGQNISTSSADGVTIGNGASNWKQSVGVGSAVNAGGQDAVAVGYQAGGGTQTVMLGSKSSGSGTNNIGIGYNVSVTGSGGATDSIGIGANAVTGFTNVIAIGSSAAATAANQALIGGASTSITSVYFGKGVTSATPAAVSLNATGGNGAGINGADITIASGLGGTAADKGGDILFKTAVTGAGTTLATRFQISENKIGFFGVTAAVQQTGGAATAGATYTATEQSMLQKAYDCLRTFGLLT